MEALAITAAQSEPSGSRSSQVTANREDRVDLPGNRLSLTAFDRCQITVHGDCEVTAYDDCQVTVFPNAVDGPAERRRPEASSTKPGQPCGGLQAHPCSPDTAV